MNEAHTIELLEEQIWRLQNSYGNGPFKDGLLSEKITKLEKELADIKSRK